MFNLFEFLSKFLNCYNQGCQTCPISQTVWDRYVCSNRLTLNRSVIPYMLYQIIELCPLSLLSCNLNSGINMDVLAIVCQTNVFTLYFIPNLPNNVDVLSFDTLHMVSEDYEPCMALSGINLLWRQWTLQLVPKWQPICNGKNLNNMVFSGPHSDKNEEFYSYCFGLVKRVQNTWILTHWRREKEDRHL